MSRFVVLMPALAAAALASAARTAAPVAPKSVIRQFATAARPVDAVGSKKPPHVIVISDSHGPTRLEPAVADALSEMVGLSGTRARSTRPAAASAAARDERTCGFWRSAIAT